MAVPKPLPRGVAPIKEQYVIKNAAKECVDDDAAERVSNPASQRPKEELGNEPPAKAVRLSGSQRKKLKKAEAAAERKKNRGMNKARKFEKIHDENMVCNNISRGRQCPRENCKFTHSIQQYLSTKPKDIRFPKPPSDSIHGSLIELNPSDRMSYLDAHYRDTPPYTKFANEHVSGIIDPETHCSASTHAGSSCYAGWTCRFLGSHVKNVGLGNGHNGTSWELTNSSSSTDNDSEDAVRRNAPDELNWLPLSVPKSLKTRQYPLYLTKAALERLSLESQMSESSRRGPMVLDRDAAKDSYASSTEVSGKSTAGVPPNAMDESDEMDILVNGHPKQTERLREAEASQSVTDTARIRKSEKRRLDWFHDELYLAPLTTTGNLPFRRLCTSLGADITCGEMGLAESYLQGSKNEWSLVRRWEGERCFGTQLCGSKPDLLVPSAEVLAREFPSGLDFIDINCGCPIDMVFSKGGGSALLDHPAKLGRIVRGMSAVTGDIPITVKLRTGTTSTQTTHKLFPRLKVDWDVGAATLHGRSRQQRYKHVADWEYIRRCTASLRQSIQQNNEDHPDEEWVAPIPIYGNGDVYSWQDYEANKALTGVDGQMLARGALIKPWLFTEIKERRDWDISSRERLDLIRQLSSYGLTHWGSDSLGVNQTRRFVCEALSFMHRYIPVGILEHVPVTMNDRPPAFQGRDDLETLLASPNAHDWVRISEMFLGAAPEEWSFTPKHKSNSYEDNAENQG